MSNGEQKSKSTLIQATKNVNQNQNISQLTTNFEMAPVTNLTISKENSPTYSQLQHGQEKQKKNKTVKKHHNISVDNVYGDHVYSDLRVKKGKKVQHRNRQSVKLEKQGTNHQYYEINIQETDYNADYDYQDQAQGQNQQDEKPNLKDKKGKYLTSTLENRDEEENGVITDMRGNIKFQSSFDKRKNQNQPHFKTINQEEHSGRSSMITDLQQRYKVQSNRLQKEIKLPKVVKNFKDRTPTSMVRLTPITADNSPSNRTPTQLSKGVNMYDTVKRERETSLHLVLMENRIKKLEDEQLRAQKKIQETLERTQKYQKIQDFKSMHRRALEEDKTSRERAQEEYRQKILQEKSEREKRVQEQYEKRLKEKRDEKYQLDNKLHNLMLQANGDADRYNNNKQEKSNNIRSDNMHGRQMRKDIRLIQELERTEDYIKKQVDTHQQILAKKQMIANLAKKELELMHRLQGTIRVQEDVVNQLEDKTGLNKRILFSRLPTDVTFSTSFKHSVTAGNSPRDESSINLEQIIKQ